MIASLRQAARELNEIAAQFQSHLRQEMARFDQSRGLGAHLMEAADADLAGAKTSALRGASQTLFVARILASREDLPPTPARLNLDRLQDSLRSTQRLIESGQALARRALLVPASSLTPEGAPGWRLKLKQLRNARTLAQDAAEKALLALPLELPEADSIQEKQDSAWDLLTGAYPPPDPAHPAARERLPLRLDRGRRLTLVSEPGVRIALTDPGIVDRHGRRIFYQEVWIQRPFSVLRWRWRVGVDTATGRHVLIKRYRPLDHKGALEALYSGPDPNYLWRLEPPENSIQPSREQFDRAIHELAHSRDDLRFALARYKNAVSEGLARGDRLASEVGQSVAAAGLPAEMRERLFVVRGRAAGVRAVLDAETGVQRALDRAPALVEKLESLAAWANRAPDEDPPAQLDPEDWEQLQEQAAEEIEKLQSASADARAAMPPDLSHELARFPGFSNELVIQLLNGRSAPGVRINSASNVR